MRRIKTTLFAVVVIAAIIFTVTQAQNMGASWLFTASGIAMIVVVVLSVIRVWLRRY